MTSQAPANAPRRTRVGTWLFPALLAATLLQNYYDLTAIFSGENLALYTYEGPLIYKIGKDSLYLALAAAIMVQATRLRRWPLSDYAIAILFVVAVLFVASFAANGAIVAIIGVRWILPFLIFLSLRDWSLALNTRAATTWLLIGLAACLGAQVYELFNMPPVFGEVLPGIPARTPGIFIAPNSAAFFGCASAACILAFSDSGRFAQAAGVWAAVLISSLAQSGTGMVVSIVIALRWFLHGRPWAFWSTTILALAFVLPNLDQVTQRQPDYVELSGGGRLEALSNIVEKGLFSVTQFGVFTNAANLRSENPEDQVAADSLVASWIGNLGLLSVVVTLLTAMFIAHRMREVDWRRAAPCVIVFALFSMTSIVFEAFPMNLYLALGIWAARQNAVAKPRTSDRPVIA